MDKIETPPSNEHRLGRAATALLAAARAAEGRKAAHLVLLDLRPAAAFTDFFLICSGQNVRQVQAIADAIEEALRHEGLKPSHIEGYDSAAWVLLDCFDFVVHVFRPDARAFYDLERLWGSARRVEIADLATGSDSARA
jgi:ribosome-associated protein